MADCHVLLLILILLRNISAAQEKWNLTVGNNRNPDLWEFMSEMMVMMKGINSKLENLEEKVERLNSSTNSEVTFELGDQSKFEDRIKAWINNLEREVVEQNFAIEKLHGTIDSLIASKPEISLINRPNSTCPIVDKRMKQLEAWNKDFLLEYRRDLQMLLFNRDCEDFRRKGSTSSGIYLIYPFEGANPIRVYCDMETDNGGWTVIQRRRKYPGSQLSFHQDWNTYKNGFGEPNEEFWLGNEAVHQLTTRAAKGYSLKIELRNTRNGTLWAALYRRFFIGSEKDSYVLNLASYIGNATDGLYAHHGRPFRTWDVEEDPIARACAWLDRSGWWYHPVEVRRPFRQQICSYLLSGTNLNAPIMDSAPDLLSQVMTLQPAPGKPLNETNTLAFLHLSTMYWMDKDGRHFDQVEMKIRLNF